MAKFLGFDIVTPYSLNLARQAWSGDDLAGGDRIVEAAGYAWLADFDLAPGFGSDVTAALETHQAAMGFADFDLDLPQRTHARAARNVTLSAAAAAGAESLDVAATSSTTIPLGAMFSIGRVLYRVAARFHGASGALSITPGLAAGAALGTVLNVNADAVPVRGHHAVRSRIRATITDGRMNHASVSLRIV